MCLCTHLNSFLADFHPMDTGRGITGKILAQS